MDDRITKKTFPERTWAPGPWRLTGEWLLGNVMDRDDAEVCTVFCQAPNECRHDHDAALIALAPEMAEAILEWDEGKLMDTAALNTTLARLADKLRKIGAPDA